MYRRNQYGKLLPGPESSGPAQHSPGAVRARHAGASGPPLAHPVDVPAAIAPDPTLHYIRCALSYQNQLLADIKALLQQLAERES